MGRIIIKNLQLLCCALLISFGGVQAQVPSQEQATVSLAGIWQGAIEIPGTPLEVTVVLRQEEQSGKARSTFRLRERQACCSRTSAQKVTA